MGETAISTEIAKALSRVGGGRIVTFRNNVGNGIVISARGTKYTAILNACLKIAAQFGAKASPIKFGLCKGSSDRIGWRTITITPEMVGKNFAQFLSVEVKTPTGTLDDDQKNFLRVVRECGGCGIVARSAEEAVNQIVTAELGL